MLILISTNILDIELDFIDMKVFIYWHCIRQKCNKFWSRHKLINKIDNIKKDVLILRKNLKQGLEHTLSAKKIYSTNFTEHNKKFCLSLHYNGANNYVFVNGKKSHKFKAKHSEIVATPSCLGNISRLVSRKYEKIWIK